MSEQNRDYDVIVFMVVGILILIFGAIWLSLLPPLAQHLKQNPQDFHYNYLYSSGSFEESVRAILYKGMPKEEVDNIFIKNGGATANKLSTQENLIKYIYKKQAYSASLYCMHNQTTIRPSWIFYLSFSHDDRLQKFKIMTDNGAKDSLADFVYPCT